MNQNVRFVHNRSRQLYKVTRERLRFTDADLLSFSFPQGGANFYVFSYPKEGIIKHTFIDAGDARYANHIRGILAENSINPVNIERIIITHLHGDHCGLAAQLAKEANPKILVHSNFRRFSGDQVIESKNKVWRSLDYSELSKCNIEYLSPSNKNELVSNDGFGFPGLHEPIEIKGLGQLTILGCPPNAQSHSLDQIIVLYSTVPNLLSGGHDGKHIDLLPTDNILFSGDLWLMKGPFYERWNKNLFLRFKPIRQGYFQIKHFISKGDKPRRDPQEQDMKAKEVLKLSFGLIKVKPGHGEEFIGSRIIPNCLLSDRDLLVKLGYSLNADKSILMSSKESKRIADIKEKAYIGFIQDMHLWKEQGYSPKEISELLVRIFKEQTGGPPPVAKDRKQRRDKLRTILKRMRDDHPESKELHYLADLTLSELKKVN